MDVLNLGEGYISPIEWLAASGAVEKKTLEYHGTARSDPLKAHHRNVLKITRVCDWGAAQIYDKERRELMAGDLRYDPSIINQDIVAQVVSCPAARWRK